MSSSSVLGTLVVRLAAELRQYKGDLDKAAQDTANAAQKIEQSTTQAGKATGKLDDAIGTLQKTAGAASGDLQDMAQGAQALHASAGAAGVGVGLLVAGAVAAAVAYRDGAKEQTAYEKSIIMTGNSAGTTASAMQAMASNIDKVVSTQAKAAAGLAMMAGTGQVAAHNLDGFTQSALEMERTLGVSVDATAKQFAELGREPVKASLKLNESMNYLTASTFAQIKAARDLGNDTQAASIAQNAYADAMKSRTAQIEANLGTLERAWRGVKEVAAETWDAMLGIGRQAGPEQELERAQKTVANLEALLARGGTGTADIEHKLAAAREALALMQENARLSQRAAMAQADQAAYEKAKIAWMQEGEKYLSKREKIEQEIARIQNEGRRANADQEEIDKRIAAVREKYADKSKSATQEMEKEAALMARLSGVNADYLEQLGRLQKMRASGKLSEDAYIESVEHLIALQPGVKRMMDEAAKSAKEEAKATADAIKANADALDARQKAATALEDQVEKERHHVAVLGLSKTAVAELDAAKMEELATSKERRAALADEIDWSGQMGDAYRAEATALRELAALKREGAIKSAAIDSAKETTAEGKRMAGQIEHSLTDSLMRGFEAGKGFAENLRDATVNMFKTMVLRPMISAVVTPVAGAALGAMGFAGQANAASTASGIGQLGNAGSLFSAGSAFGGIANGLGAWGSGGSVSGMFANASLYSGAELLGAALPVVGGVALLASLLGNMGGGGPTITRGGLSRQYGADGATLGSTPLEGWGSNAASEEFVNAYAASIRKALSSFDLASALQVNYSQSDGRGGLFESLSILRDAQGGAASPTYYSGELGRSAENFALVFARGALNALQASELPASVEAFWAGLTPETATLEQIQTAVNSAQQFYTGINDLRTSLESMPFSSIQSLSFDAAAALVRFSGGLDQLKTNLDSYLSNYHTAEEQRAAKVNQITRVLNEAGLAVTADQVATATRDQFRDVAESLRDGSENGERMYAVMLSVNRAFAEITPSAQAAAEAVPAAAEALSDTMRSLQDDTTSLRVELLRASGDAAGARAAQRQLDIAGMTAAEAAIYDYNQSMRDQIDAVQNARDTLATAYQRESSALQQTIDKFASFSKSLRDFRDQLLMGDLSVLSPEQKYLAAKDQFERTRSLALAGDPQAMANLQNVSQGFLQASRDFNASTSAYASDFSAVSTSLESVASAAMSQAGIAQAQLTELQASVSGLIDINQSVISVRDAILTLRTASAINPGAHALGGGSAGNSAISGASSDFISQNTITGLRNGFSKADLVSNLSAEASNYGITAEMLLYNSAMAAGINPDERMGWASGTANQWARDHDLPEFAGGGIASGLFSAGERGTEIMYSPAPVRVLSNSQTNAAVIDGGEVSALLRQIVAELRADKVQRGAVAEASLEKLDTVANKLDGTRRAIRQQPVGAGA